MALLSYYSNVNTIDNLIYLFFIDYAKSVLLGKNEKTTKISPKKYESIGTDKKNRTKITIIIHGE